MRYVTLPTSTVDAVRPVRPRRWVLSLSRVGRKVGQRPAGVGSWAARSSSSAAARDAML
jgi:hypothetical protein